jgi:CubicO group peptidase (beta-lactamase class C family)
VLDLHRGWQSRIEAGTLLGPRLLSLGSWVVNGARGITSDMPAFFKASTREEGQQLARYFKDEGYDFIKIYTGATRDGYFGLAEEARRLGIPFAGHEPSRLGAIELSNAGQGSIEHSRVFLLNCWPGADSLKQGLFKLPQTTLRRRMVDEYDPKICADVFRTFAKNRTYITPTLRTRKMDAFAHDSAFKSDARLKYIPISAQLSWTIDAGRMVASDPSPEGRRSYMDFYLRGRSLTYDAYRAGVPVMVGTDAGDTFVFAGSSVHDEIDELVAAGFSSAEALRAATLSGAEYLGRAADLGPIRAGRLADLVLLDADPLADAANVRRIHAVIANGRLLDRAALDSILVRVEEAARPSPQQKLWAASLLGDSVGMAAALDAGARIDSVDVHFTPLGRRALNYAVVGNHLPAVKLLLARGASVNLTDTSGATAAMHAVQAGAVDALRLLIDGGADVARVTNAGMTALAFARAQRLEPAIQLLSQRTQDPPDRAALQALDSVVTSYVARGYAVGGELLVLHRGKVLLHEAYGLADRESNRPWTVGTISNIRSMTKPITGAAVQLLIDRGKLSLDDSVSKYLPSFDNDRSRAITVRQVLTHRAGLPLTIVLERIDQFPNLLAQVNAIGEKGPAHAPGSKFWYSDAGTDVAAALVQVVSGRPFAEFVRTELLEPLGMTDTFFGTDATDPRFGRIATAYFGSPGSWVRLWSPTDGKPLYPFAWGSQTLYSTPRDYARFLQLWVDQGRVGSRQVLSKEAVLRQTTPASPMSMLGSDARVPTAFRGLEVHYGQMAVLHVETGRPDRVRILGHSGSDGTNAWAWPDRDLMVFYFTQSRGGTTPLRFEEALERFLINPGVAAEPVPVAYQGYVGRYVANFGRFANEVFEIGWRNGKLVLDIPSALVFDLVWLEDPKRWAAEIARDGMQLVFEPREGKPAGKLEFYQGDKAYDVPRVGSPLADSLGTDRVVAPAELADAAGRYEVTGSQAEVEVIVQDGGLAIRPPGGGGVAALRPSRRADHWHVRESPNVAIIFNRDPSGKVVSMTRHTRSPVTWPKRAVTRPP